MPLTCTWLLSYGIFGCLATEQETSIPSSVYQDTGNTQLSQTKFYYTVFLKSRNDLIWKKVHFWKASERTKYTRKK